MNFRISKEARAVIDEDDPFSDIAQTERIGLGDFIIATIIGVACWTLLTFWDLPMVHPSLWDDMATATGTRPASHLLHGYFVAFSSAIFRIFGMHKGHAVLNAMGPIVLASISVVAYAALREILAFIMRARPQRSPRRSYVMQIASIVGAFAFVLNEPVWRAGQYLSETTILLALTMFSLEFFFVFLRKGTLKYAYLCAFSLGLLAAETPAAILFLVGFLVVNNIVLKVLPVLESPFFRPGLMAISRWYLTFIFVFAILIGVAVNCISFVCNHGLVSEGASIGALPHLYLQGWAGVAATAASPLGWILWVGVCFAPFIVSIIRFPDAADEERLLSYTTGIVFLICGVAAFTQVQPISDLWFWKHCPVASDYLLSTGLLWSATTMAAAITILGVDSLCRNHERLAQEMFGPSDAETLEDAENRMAGMKEEKDDDSDDLALDSPISTAVRRTAIIVVPAAMIVAMIPARMETGTCAILGIIRDALNETVDEAGDAQYIFTDGNLDTGIELTSRFHGGSLKCLPLVSRTADSTRDRHLRTRGMAYDAEDIFSFRSDTGTGLRSWIRDKPKRLEKCAVQMGFDLWKREGKSLPPMGGMLSRPSGWQDKASQAAGIAHAHALAERTLDIYNTGAETTSVPVREAFESVQWRLARMCIYRSEQADLAGDATNAIAEASLAQQLNARNATYRNLLVALGRQNDMMMSRLTPREGLQLALVRADFTMGKMYAETILVADPENADANFAMGMYYAKNRQLTRAGEYLKRCLIRRPNEPSIYNNLAMVELELGKLDAAELNAKKALAIVPDSATVQDTLKKIRAKREGATSGHGQ